MIPTNTGLRTLPCNPTSSHCVSWEGPDLPCIHLCRGDSVTDVVYKSALVLCDLKDQLDLSDLDLKSIFDICAACPQPAKTLQNILQLLIDKIKTLEELIDELDGSGSSEDMLIRIATCFRTDDGTGDVVTELKHSDYTKAIAVQVCEILTELAGVTTRLNSMETGIDELNDRIESLESGENGLDELKEQVEALDTILTGITTALGTNVNIAEIVSEECAPSGTSNSVLSLAAADGSALWAGNSRNASESLKRLWIAMCDVRSAVKIIQDNCCKISCDDILIDFDIRLSDDRQQATLFFAFKSHLPTGFSDVNAMGNKLTITDANGASAQFFIKIVDEVQNPEGIVLDLSGTALDPKLDYFFTMDAAMRSSSLTCVKCINNTLTYKDTCAYCEITVSGNGSANGSLIIIYEDISSTNLTN